ncbi:MAG: FimV/HubP family polar landmark protein [Mariprofundales bacterium]
MSMRVIIIAAMLIMQPLAASAVSLGRIDVASHLDETFFAEIALNLDADESLSSIFVDLASPIEYRFLEVYRDQAIDTLRTTIKQDKRGLRVEIASAKALRSPYINLVLRVRHGRATHFKKFPIFLALSSIATPKIVQGKPVITAPQPSAQPIENTAKTNTIQPDEFTPFEGWARTDRYGPMVYGDTLFTVARRLRTDKRYSVRQVAMALFNKNRDKFSKGNINLIKEGSFLDTPTANEVEALSPSEASAAMIAQTKAWKQLKQQPKFARVAEAQKNRYTKRVRVGSQGEGVRHTTTAPAAAAATEPEVLPVHDSASTTATTTATVAPTQEAASTPELSTEAQQRIAQLKTDNDILQATVTANNKRLAELEKRLTAPAASSDPKLKRLEVRLMRIQRQLEQERANNKGEVLMWLIYAAAGIIVLLIVVIGVLMRRQPPHPAQLQQAAPAAPAEKITEAAPQKQASPSDKMVPSPPISNETPTAATTESTEASTEESTEESDANADDNPDIDPLTEADVYLRYGMEEEAETQVNLALQLTPENPAAHAKLIEVRQARDNSAGAEAAKTAALALLTGSALATFEELLASASPQKEVSADETPEPSSEKPSEKPSEEPSKTETPADSAADNSEEETSDDDLLSSISNPDSDKDLDALLDIQPEPATYQDDDDELQNLLSTVDSDEPESEEDDVLDLSMDSSDDTDLDALLSSLSTPDDNTEGSSADESTSDTAEDIAEESVETTEEPETVAPTKNSDLEGDLAFDTSDIDLSKAKVEEPLVNTTSVDNDSDLAFDASGLDLSGIVLPSSTTAETMPASTAITAAPSDEPALETTGDDISLDLDTDLATEPTDIPEPTIADHAESAASSTPATSGSTLDISLDMDDLDALLATDEALPKPTPESTPEKAAETAPQSVDDELGSLLDGLDDLDFGGDK